MTMLLAAILASSTVGDAGANVGTSCPAVTIGRLDNGAELRIAMQQYSAFYGPYLVLQLNQRIDEFSPWLLRVGAVRLGDGRPVLAESNSEFPWGNWQILPIHRAGLAAISASERMEVVANSGPSLSFALDVTQVAAFRACVDALPTGSNETPANVPSNGWRYAVLPGNRLPTYIRMPTPEYPARARRERRQGVTMTRVIVQPDGSPGPCSIANSSGSPDLDVAACDATQTMRFRAATDAVGEPIAMPVQVPIRWQLTDS